MVGREGGRVTKERQERAEISANTGPLMLPTVGCFHAVDACRSRVPRALVLKCLLHAAIRHRTPGPRRRKTFRVGAPRPVTALPRGTEGNGAADSVAP